MEMERIGFWPDLGYSMGILAHATVPFQRHHNVQYGVFIAAFWEFIITTTCTAVYVTRIFNNANSNTPSGIFWHASANGWAWQ